MAGVALSSEGVSRLTVGQENSGPVDLYYEDHGSGAPVVLLSGWPQSSVAWEKQLAALLAAGRRVLTYDRRGFGASSRPATGYDYDTLASDLNQLLVRLDLREVALVGSSLGAGEVIRYLSRYGEARVARAVLLSAGPLGVGAGERMRTLLTSDRLAYLSEFLEDAYNFDALGGRRVSRQVLQAYWNEAAGASAQGTRECLDAWMTDLGADLERVHIPVLELHGEADRIVPAARGQGARRRIVDGAPHGLLWTHAEEVNEELLRFLD